MHSLTKVHDFLTVGAAALLQEAVIAGLELPDSYLDTNAKGTLNICGAALENGVKRVIHKVLTL